MGQRVEYGAPKKINAFSVSLVLLVLGFAYWMWRFFPSYLDAWTVDHVLREVATQVYRANRIPNDTDKIEVIKELLDKAKSDIRKQAGINDPELTVSANIEGDTAFLYAEYTVQVTHPVVDKTTTLHFKREEKTDLKRVDWDK